MISSNAPPSPVYVFVCLFVPCRTAFFPTNLNSVTADAFLVLISVYGILNWQYLYDSSSFTAYRIQCIDLLKCVLTDLKVDIFFLGCLWSWSFHVPFYLYVYRALWATSVSPVYSWLQIPMIFIFTLLVKFFIFYSIMVFCKNI